jgi:iron(III) transport system ATP-binding protein
MIDATMTSPRTVLKLDDIRLNFGDVVALDGVNLTVTDGEIICLLGHSGCGKSTLLRAIAGVEIASRGTITLDEATVFGPGQFVEPEHRRIGFMLQDYALFPHLTARQNIAFGLKKMAKPDAKNRVDELSTRLGIEHLLERYPHMLSGGEQQRIALARALAPRPHVLLMDEPFSNLDRGLRDRLRTEVMALLRGLNTTAIIVTHDPEEALAVGDRIVLMHKGKIIEQGRGSDLFNAPKSAYTAEFFSRMNRIPAARDGQWLNTALGRFPAPDTPTEVSEIFIRPRALSFGAKGITATIISHAVLGEIEEWHIAVPELPDPILMRTSQRYKLSPGDSAKLNVSEDELLIFFS